MRLTSAFLALPLLASAAEGPFEQYKAQFQNFLGSFGSYLPNPAKENPVKAAEAKAGSLNLNTLTLQNWKDTLYSHVKPAATKPDEWWVLVTGGNKSCFGRCLGIESAFNETAAKFAVLPNSPHMAILNCDDQPVLCNSWSASAGVLWLIEMLPRPAPVDIYLKRLNLTSTTSKTLLDIQASENKEALGFSLHDGYFHPFDGVLAQNGLALPLGYFFWILNVVPSWAMMLGISFLSRSIMNRRMNRQTGGRGAANPAAAAARGAPPGDATS